MAATIEDVRPHGPHLSGRERPSQRRHPARRRLFAHAGPVHRQRQVSALRPRRRHADGVPAPVLPRLQRRQHDLIVLLGRDPHCVPEPAHPARCALLARRVWLRVAAFRRRLEGDEVPVAEGDEDAEGETAEEDDSKDESAEASEVAKEGTEEGIEEGTEEEPVEEIPLPQNLSADLVDRLHGEEYRLVELINLRQDFEGAFDDIEITADLENKEAPWQESVDWWKGAWRGFLGLFGIESEE